MAELFRQFVRPELRHPWRCLGLVQSAHARRVGRGADRGFRAGIPVHARVRVAEQVLGQGVIAGCRFDAAATVPSSSRSRGDRGPAECVFCVVSRLLGVSS